jgi:phage I-like protein
VRPISLLGLLIALLTVGCWGGSDKRDAQVTTRQVGPQQSEAAFIEVADAICGNHQSRREDLESQVAALGPLNTADEAHEVADLLRKEGRNLKSEIRELEARRPASPEPALSSFISVTRARAAALDHWARAYDELDQRRIRTLQIRVGMIAATAELRARKFGLRTCGR